MLESGPANNKSRRVVFFAWHCYEYFVEVQTTGLKPEARSPISGMSRGRLLAPLRSGPGTPRILCSIILLHWG